MTIQERITIAEFMGYKQTGYTGINGDKYLCDAGDNKNGWASQLNYDTDWNLLMEVCRKFHHLFDAQKVIEYGIYQNHCDSIDKDIITYKIENVIPEIILAIEWYNSISHA